MRTTLLLLACLFETALAQDAPDKALKYSFSLEQGWSITSEPETDFPYIQEFLLQDGFTPKFRPPFTPPTFPVRDRDGKIVPHHKGISGPKPSDFWKRICDPLKLEGSLTLLPGDAGLLEFKRIEYWDRSQSYWIEFEADKVRTHELGAVEKWSGSRAEWAARLPKLEAPLRDAYLKVVTPQKTAPAKDKIALEGSASSDPGWRLFVASALEDQLLALFLARLDGVSVERVRWPAGTNDGPEQPRLLARALIDRIQAQSLGTFAPEPAREHPGRVLKNQAWQGSELAIPSLGWRDGRPWATERLRPVEDARGRLRALSEGAALRGEWIEPDAWRSAVEDEAKQLRKLIPVTVPALPGSLDDALLPKTRAPGNTTYDFREKTDRREGQLQSSDADVRGTVSNLEVIFFHSGMSVWRSSMVRLETWYKSKVMRD